MKIVITNINKLTLDLANFLSNESEKYEIILLSEKTKHSNNNLQKMIKIYDVKNDLIASILNLDLDNKDIIICNFDNNYDNNIVAQNILNKNQNIKIYILVSDDSLLDLYNNNDHITVINVNNVINNLLMKTISQEQ
ncbi:MAG: hypothetical protein CL748_04845 [Chloroflexi bacterium]|nr:hypothetical protein [Chloroflexota bacterium]|tara:strand:+ start:481 stop:891 length:411 start_codon:yes stop_codon:yes gene_type:complete